MPFEYNIDPELRDHFSSMPPLLRPEWDLDETVAAWARNPRPPVPYAQSPNISIENRPIPCDDETASPFVRIYQPTDRKADEKLPVYLWIHGGGFIAGDVFRDDGLCDKIVRECDCIVVSVEYRLAPKHPYPAGINDCYEALKWLTSDAAADLNLDLDRIAIGGASAGGCLAAALALMARDKGGPQITCQILMIPVTDDRMETPSSHEFTDMRVWNRNLALKAWGGYLKNMEGKTPAYAAPNRAESLKDLPPAYVTVEEQDLLRDEGIAYAQKLMQHGVPTELHVYPGAFHGSFGDVPKAGVSRRHLGGKIAALKKVFEKTQD